MFGKLNKNIEKLLEELTGEDTLPREVRRLEKEEARLTKEIETLKHKKKIEEEDIKHLVKLEKEKNGIEFQKKEMTLQKKHDDDVAKVKDEYRDKLEKHLQEETKNIKEMYGQILERLPNVTAHFGTKK